MNLKAGFVISYVMDFLLIVQWIAELICRRKQKTLQFLHDLTLSSKDKNLAQCGVSKGSALRLRLTGSVVQPRVSDDLLSYKAIGSNYLSFVVTSMLVSTSPLDEAGTATTVIRAVALRKSQLLKLSFVFYSLAERLSMFSAKLNAFESILLVCIFLRYQ